MDKTFKTRDAARMYFMAAKQEGDEAVIDNPSDPREYVENILARKKRRGE